MTRLRVLAGAFTCCPPGMPGFTGGESLLGWNLIRQIARFHDVWVLTQEDDRKSFEQSDFDPDWNISFVYVKMPSWLRSLLRIQGGHQLYYYIWQIKAWLVARRLQKEVEFDLFHHVTYANDWGASFMGALLPVPYIRGPGGGSHRTPKGFEQEYSFSGRTWERLRSIGQWLFRHDPVFVKGHRRAHAILVCNRESMASLPARWKSKAEFFPVNGISTEDLQYSQGDGKTGDIFRVLSAGTLIRVKGFALAIKSFARFAERHPGSSFTIIGNGPELSHLEETIRRYNLEDQVHLEQAIPRKELLDAMASFDVFLFPSLRDGGGAVVVEAMSAGKPVICLDNGGPGMHITQECGLKLIPRSATAAVDDLAQALEKLYTDTELRQRLGRAGRVRAEKEYHWDKLGGRLNEIYLNCLFGAAD